MQEVIEKSRKNTGGIRDEQGRFLPGISGNPDGRPRGAGISITTEIKRKLAEVPEGQKASYLQLLINRILKLAIQDGDVTMIRKIWEYIDGQPKQSIDFQGNLTVGTIAKLLGEPEEYEKLKSKSDSESSG